MKQILTAALLLTTVLSFAQKSKNDFITLPSGLQYRIVVDAKNPKANLGDIIKMNYVFSNGKDSTIISTFDKNMQAQQFTCAEKQFNGDVMEGFKMLGKGDSAIFKMPADSLYRQGMPPFAHAGELMILKVRVIDVMNKDDFEKQQQAEAAARTTQEDATIQKYISDNHLTAMKTADGLYYVVDEKGSGDAAVAGKSVTVNYTGMLLDGTKFDSNVDPSFNHVEPFSFSLGQGQVIKGWDEGIGLFNVGGKGKLIIPSGLAYGPSAMGKIPAYSILIFDIEVVAVK